MTTRQAKYPFKNQALGLLLFLSALLGNVQEASSQRYAVKTNGLSWLTLTPNVEGEIKLSDRFTGSLSLHYRPWHVLSDNRKITGIALQPEVRYWFCQTFYQHFAGIHLNYADYNGGLKAHRYQGYLLGGGITYGYQMILSRRWNLEFSIGAGYARMNHDVYDRPRCGDFLKHECKNYWGITKVGVSLVYLIK